MGTDRRGFTLIEVLICLAIVGGALISLLHARNRSYDKAAEALSRRQMQFLSTFKMQEILIGAETARIGSFKNEEFPDLRWKKKTKTITLNAFSDKSSAVSPSSTGAGRASANVDTITLVISDGSGEVIFELVAYQYEPVERSEEGESE